MAQDNYEVGLWFTLFREPCPVITAARGYDAEDSDLLFDSFLT